MRPFKPKPKERPKSSQGWHQHKWVEVNRGFYVYTTQNLITGTETSGSMVTLITYQCSCGEFKQLELKGHIPHPTTKELPS